MSEPRDPDTPAPQPTETPPPEPPLAPSRRRSGTAAWLLALLVLVVAGVAASPAWAPAVAPLLPWGEEQRAASDGRLATELRQLQERVEKVENTALPLDQVEGLEPRIAKLEQAAGRLDRIEAAAKDAQQQRAAAAEEMQKVGQRLTAVEARLATLPAGGSDLPQRLDSLAASLKDATGRLDALEKSGRDSAGTVQSLGSRVDALEKAEQQQAGADRTDTGLLLVLLQIRDAVAAGRPFAADYDAFAALAHDRPKIAAAAAPLAATAEHGVASREALRERLDALAPQIAEPRPPEATGWPGRAWARVRSLVSVRRIGGPGQSPAEAAVSEAQHALAVGDLAAAIGRLKGLSGAAAEAANPWLDLAEARLHAEEALRRTRQALTEALAAQHRPGRP